MRVVSLNPPPARVMQDSKSLGFLSKRLTSAAAVI